MLMTATSNKDECASCDLFNLSCFSLFEHFQYSLLLCFEKLQHTHTNSNTSCFFILFYATYRLEVQSSTTLLKHLYHRF